MAQAFNGPAADPQDVGDFLRAQQGFPVDIREIESEIRFRNITEVSFFIHDEIVFRILWF